MNKYSSEDFWPTVRVVHLPYGCRVINEQNPKVIFEPEVLRGEKASFEILKYHDLFKALRHLGLVPIGVDYYTHSGQVIGKTPPEWRHYFSTENEWVCIDLSDKWSMIGHESHKRKEWPLADLAARINHQSRVCSFRIRQMSESYAALLNSEIIAGDFKEDRQFDNEFVWQAYLSVQTYLVDACILRDYLVEFYAAFLRPTSPEISTEKVTKIAPLKKVVLNKISEPDEVTKFIIDSVAKNGWLTRLGEYRDSVVHSAPLSSSTGHLFAKTTSIILPDGKDLPAVTLPIPSEPMVASKARAKGEYFEEMERREHFISSACDDPASPDGLRYCHTSHNLMLYLSNLLAQRSPVPPTIPTISVDEWQESRESSV